MPVTGRGRSNFIIIIVISRLLSSSCLCTGLRGIRVCFKGFGVGLRVQGRGLRGKSEGRRCGPLIIASYVLGRR